MAGIPSEEQNDNLSAVLYKAKDLRLEQRPIPDIADNEVLIKIISVGLCGSDIHFYDTGAIGANKLKEPMVLGHESSGVVTKVGKNVKALANGDRVLMENAVHCNSCEQCKKGRNNLCKNLKFLASNPSGGVLARFCALREDLCFKLPENVTYEEAALVEPFSVALHACNRAEIRAGDRVLIVGADLIPHRLDFAKSLDVDYTYLVDKNKCPRESAYDIRKLFTDNPDICIECSGSESGCRMAIFAAKSGGKVVNVGLACPEKTLPIVETIQREIDIIASCRYANCFPTALAFVATGKINVKPFITHRFPLEQTEEAIQRFKNPAEKAIKIIINCNQ